MMWSQEMRGHILFLSSIYCPSSRALFSSEAVHVARGEGEGRGGRGERGGAAEQTGLSPNNTQHTRNTHKHTHTTAGT